MSTFSKRKKEKQVEHFCDEFVKLQTEEAIGIIRLLGIHLYEEELLDKEILKEKLNEQYKSAENKKEWKPQLTPRPTETLLSEMIEKFSQMSNKNRKIILHMVEDAASIGGNDE